ncbi:MAG TPA: IclR family transcriptional regulator [Candidatus Brocadiia bacterium]|nr:IclR family transcriptional regulator [Candidatus Brocadiia bacterium]
MPEFEGKRDYRAPAAQSLLDIMELLARSDAPYGVAEISRQTGASTNMVFRIMRVMEESGYIERGSKSKFTLTPKALALAGHDRGMGVFYATAYLHMKKLAATARETVQLYVPTQDKALLLLEAASGDRFGARAVPGSALPNHATCAGKLLMALGVIKQKDKKLTKLTPHTIASANALKKELKDIAEAGYALNREETILGVRAVSVPVMGGDDSIIGALCMLAPAQRLDNQELARLLPKVKQTAVEISRELHANEEKLQELLRVDAPPAEKF